MKKINLNGKYSKVFLIIAIILLIVAIIITINISNKIREKENTLFSISKIIIYNSAGIIDNTNTSSLINLNIDQFSDISIYIDNSSEENLDKLNTIKSLYIDNITIDSKNNDTQKIFNYKNSLSLGKYIILENPEKDKITFDVAKNNEEHKVSNYNNPTFYMDCSNPITLGYVNKGIIQNYSISNINLDNISTTLSFTVHIVNNAGHKLSCKMDVDIYLDDDFLNNGYSYLSVSVSGDKYKFLRD